MKIITDKNGYSSATLRWKKDSLPYLENWLNDHQGHAEAARALEDLIMQGIAKYVLQKQLESGQSDFRERREQERRNPFFLDTPKMSVLTSEYEKQHRSQKKQNPADVDTVGMDAGVDQEGEVWARRKVLLEF